MLAGSWVHTLRCHSAGRGCLRSLGQAQAMNDSTATVTSKSQAYGGKTRLPTVTDRIEWSASKAHSFRICSVTPGSGYRFHQSLTFQSDLSDPRIRPSPAQGPLRTIEQPRPFVELPRAACKCSNSCAYTYIHTYIHTYRHTDIQTYRHTYIQTYRHTDIQIDRQTDGRTDGRTYLPTYLPTCIRTCIHTYIHACMHACIHTYVHTHI